MKNEKLWAEMARRKIKFHPNEKWDEIKLWGLFNWGYVRKLIESGELKTEMRKEHRVLWVRPSKKAWEEKIKPLIENYTLDQLTGMAGWK